MQLSFRHFFPAVKIRKAVNAIQYVGKLVPGGQFDILLQYLPFLLFIASVKNIVEVVASHMDLEQLHIFASGRPPNRVRVPAPGQIFS